jgi:ribosomal protein S12 methylthiotransferase accessory factor
MSFSVALYPSGSDGTFVSAGGRNVHVPLRIEHAVEALGADNASIRGGEAAEDGTRDAAQFLSDIGRLLNAPGEAPRGTADCATVIMADESFRPLLSDSLLNALCPALRITAVVDAREPVPDLLGSGGSLLLALTDSFDYRRFSAWETWARARSAHWAALYRTAQGAGYGPFVEPAGTPTMRDLARRWVCAAADEKAQRAVLDAPSYVRYDQASSGMLAWCLATFLADVERWITGKSCRGLWRNVNLDAARQDITQDPVLPVDLSRIGQSEQADATAGAHLTPDDVVNQNTGIVLRLRQIKYRTQLPSGLIYVESQTADMSRLHPWASNIYNAGSAWDDLERAKKGATGEAIERYCGNAIDEDRLVYGSYDELRRQGRPAVDPRRLALFTPRQYAEPGFPFVPFDTAVRTHWVQGISLASSTEIMVPASLTFINWNTGRFEFDPPLHPAYYPGIAAGHTLDAAISNGLEEVIERDAAMVWWLSGCALPTVTGAPAEFARSRLGPDSPMNVRLVPLPNRFGVPTFAGVVHDAQHAIGGFGLAARATPEEAATKALLEGFGLVEAAVDLQRPDGGFWHDYEALGLRQAVKPIRADRHYLDSYRKDFRDVTDLWCQLQVQLDPRSWDTVKARLSGPETRGWERLPRVESRTAAQYVKRMCDAEFEPIYVDVTTADVAAAGWHAVRVIIPGLVPNFPTAFPPLGGDRVATEPVRLGWAEEPLTPAAVYSFPMPYA